MSAGQIEHDGGIKAHEIHQQASQEERNRE